MELLHQANKLSMHQVQRGRETLNCLKWYNFIKVNELSICLARYDCKPYNFLNGVVSLNELCNALCVR